MAVYTVHEPPPRGASGPDPEGFVFVRDAFSFWALLFGPLWMLRHRMWLVLLGYILVITALGVLLGQVRAPAGLALCVNSLLALLIGFEAPTLRRFTLGRRGYSNVGIVVGDDLDLAERRFFESWVKSGRDFGRRSDGPLPLMPHARSDVLGLFPEPGAAP